MNDIITRHATVAKRICEGLKNDTAVDGDASLCNQMALMRVTAETALEDLLRT